MTRTLALLITTCGCALRVGALDAAADTSVAPDVSMAVDGASDVSEAATAPDASVSEDDGAPDDRRGFEDVFPLDAGDVTDATPATPDRPVPGDGAASERVRRARPSCPDAETPGCAVVRVIGGTFDMGTDFSMESRGPLGVVVDGFAMDAYEVTVARFHRFFEAGMPPAPSSVRYPGGMVPMRGTVREPRTVQYFPSGSFASSWSRAPGAIEQLPIVALTWATAQSFCVWDGGRLPTEAEWEWVTFNLPDGRPLPRTYPRGNAPVDCRDANTRCDGSAALTPIGLRSPEGLFFDLGGNVAEWTADLVGSYRDESCWGGRVRPNPVCTEVEPDFNQIRGSDTIHGLPSTRFDRVAGRLPGGPPGLDWYGEYTGFRCAYDE